MERAFPTPAVAADAAAVTEVVGALEEEMTWGLGVWVDHDGYGMGGLGGSLGMADPALGLAEATSHAGWATTAALMRWTLLCAHRLADAARRR